MREEAVGARIVSLQEEKAQFKSTLDIYMCGGKGVIFHAAIQQEPLTVAPKHANTYHKIACHTSLCEGFAGDRLKYHRNMLTQFNQRP